jgi:hypothetical protein
MIARIKDVIGSKLQALKVPYQDATAGSFTSTSDSSDGPPRNSCRPIAKSVSGQNGHFSPGILNDAASLQAGGGSRNTHTSNCAIDSW